MSGKLTDIKLAFRRHEKVFIIYKIISLVFGTGRVSEEVEKDGMDMAYHGERGFDISD